MSKALLALLVVAASLAGMWFGEDTRLFSVLGLFASIGCVTTGALFPALALTLTASIRPLGRLFAVGGCLVAFIAGVTLGEREARSAVDECRAQAEAVRNALQAYRDRHGTFPEALAQLAVSPPGGLLLRGSLLDYARTVEGYELLLPGRYPFAQYYASEAHGFQGRK